MDIEHSRLIERLFMEMYDNLLTYARCSLKEEALAEEAVQETFRIACQKADNLQASSNPQGWLVNTLKNTIRNIKRNRDHIQRILAQYQQAHSGDSVSEDMLSLSALYGGITETEEFKLLKEFAVDGRSHLEMATDRGITVNACKKRLQRAKEHLRLQLMNDVTE